MKKSLRALAPVGVAAAAGVLLLPGAASADSTSSYQAALKALNHSQGSGTVTVQLSGSRATITENVTDLAARFNGKPFPHVQHIHIAAGGVCPTTMADMNMDGVVSTTEGQPSYGPIGTTLSTKGDTSPAAGTTLTVAPAGGSFTYSRTIDLDAKTLSSLTSGKAVIVVHGLDPKTLSAKAQAEKSDLVPALPLAATSPTLCGPLALSQMADMPTGSASTGGGSTSGRQDAGILGLGGGLVVAAGGVLALRRRQPRRN